MDDAPNFGELAVKQRVRIEIARRAQRAFDNLSLEIGDDKVSGGQGGVIDSAGLDHHEGLGSGPVDTADVSKGVRREAAASDLLIGAKDLLAKRFKQHNGLELG